MMQKVTVPFRTEGGSRKLFVVPVVDAITNIKLEHGGRRYSIGVYLLDFNKIGEGVYVFHFAYIINMTEPVMLCFEVRAFGDDYDCASDRIVERIEAGSLLNEIAQLSVVAFRGEQWNVMRPGTVMSEFESLARADAAHDFGQHVRTRYGRDVV